MRARAPASSANLGPGFDTLAVALSLYVEVIVDGADALTVTAEGEGSDLPRDASHLAARVACEVAGHDRLHVHVKSEIPVSRGLGSSASLAVAAAAAAGAMDPLAVGARVDGHPENAAASVLGGLVTAATIDDQPVAARLALDSALGFVVVVPDRSLPTKDARAALPTTVPHADAAFNLGRMGLLIAGLADASVLVPRAMDDRLHQLPRAALFPEAGALLSGLVERGALSACWSGAGPTILGVCRAPDTERLRSDAEDLLASVGVAGRALAATPDLDGLVVGE
jgi:homoserine kinase